jgi:DNA sulfur modification protein DndB
MEISEFKDKSEKGAVKYRNKENGGNLLFRPIGLYPFVQASIEIQKRTGKTFENIFEKLNKMNFTINQIPWKNIVWNNIEKTMIMGSSGLVKLILIYSFDNKILRGSERTSLVYKYSSKLGLDQPDSKVLDKLPKID